MSWFEKYNILARLRAIENKVNKDIDPRLAEQTSILSDQIRELKSLIGKVNNEIIPAINETAGKATSASNLAIEAQKRSESVLDIVVDAKNIALDAKSKIMDAVATVQEIKDRFIFAADGLETDIIGLKAAAEEFITVLTRELSGLGSQFKEWGTKIADTVKTVGEKAQRVGGELGEAVVQIGKPLKACADHAYEMGEDMVDGDVLGAVGHAEKALEYLTFKGYGGQDSVLEELMEAFKEISTEFIALYNALVTFGDTTEKESDDLKNRIEHANLLIKQSFNKFTNAFYAVFFNLQYRLKGDTPP